MNDTPLSWDLPTDPEGERDGGAPLLPGLLAARFRYLSQIAVASQAIVWLVEDKEANNDLRVLKLYGSAVFSGRSERHLELLRRLPQAAGLAEIRDTGVLDAEGGRVWELLERIDGRGLHEAIAEARPDAAAAAALLRRLTETLAAVHQAGLVYGDLKPANIVLRGGSPTDPVLLDYGCLEEDHAHATLRATEAYRAPEWRWEVVETASDFWSLGLIAHELAVGRHPLQGRSRPEIYEALFNEEIPLDPALPGRWRALCEGLLCYRPEQRWGAAQVAEWLAGGNPPVPPRSGGLRLRNFRLCYDNAELAERLLQPIEPPLAPAEWQKVIDWVAARPGAGPLVARTLGRELVEEPAPPPLQRQVAAALRLAPARLAFGGVILEPDRLAASLVPADAVSDGAILALFTNRLLGFIADRLPSADSRARWLKAVEDRWHSAWGRYADRVPATPAAALAGRVGAWFLRVALHAAAAEPLSPPADTGEAGLFDPDGVAAPQLRRWREYAQAVGFERPSGHAGPGTLIDISAWPDPSELAEAIGQAKLIRMRPGRYEWPANRGIAANVTVKADPAANGRVILALRNPLVMEQGALLEGLDLTGELPGQPMVLLRGAGAQIVHCRLSGKADCFIEATAPDVVIECIEIAADGDEVPAAGYGIQVRGGPCRVENCRIALDARGDRAPVGIAMIGATATVNRCTVTGGTGIKGQDLRDGAVIADCTLRRSSQGAISLRGGRRHRLENNRIERPAGVAVRLARCGAIVRGNTIVDGEGDGIVLADCPEAVLEGNRADLFGKDARGLAFTLTGGERIELSRAAVADDWAAAED